MPDPRESFDVSPEAARAMAALSGVTLGDGEARRAALAAVSAAVGTAALRDGLTLDDAAAGFDVLRAALGGSER
ncbi:hypothetical protein GCM10008171_05140 [Methylopila jiangsuensis]|uniref:Uncharacterized protein n=1 Tax=Methylopila jiangsuensis TaxID=586230 RepID=A0A9W6JG48_9HYPH|nr:hypothetical protein [Methylopila jiangsuensis]MDR6285502.1 hypothetical protein [Methylopila jiangsuensis]GLK75260.1 hypothetical protein GCM10008171_05140 [Methylopila jiangsuensis]